MHLIRSAAVLMSMVKPSKTTLEGMGTSAMISVAEVIFEQGLSYHVYLEPPFSCSF